MEKFIEQIKTSLSDLDPNAKKIFYNYGYECHLTPLEIIDQMDTMLITIEQLYIIQKQLSLCLDEKEIHLKQLEPINTSIQNIEMFWGLKKLPKLETNEIQFVDSNNKVFHFTWKNDTFHYWEVLALSLLELQLRYIFQNTIVQSIELTPWNDNFNNLEFNFTTYKINTDGNRKFIDYNYKINDNKYKATNIIESLININKNLINNIVRCLNSDQQYFLDALKIQLEDKNNILNIEKIDHYIFNNFVPSLQDLYKENNNQVKNTLKAITAAIRSLYQIQNILDRFKKCFEIDHSYSPAYKLSTDLVNAFNEFETINEFKPSYMLTLQPDAQDFYIVTKEVDHNLRKYKLSSTSIISLQLILIYIQLRKWFRHQSPLHFEFEGQINKDQYITQIEIQYNTGIGDIIIKDINQWQTITYIINTHLQPLINDIQSTLFELQEAHIKLDNDPVFKEFIEKD
jgi:hypothetical protein